MPKFSPLTLSSHYRPATEIEGFFNLLYAHLLNLWPINRFSGNKKHATELLPIVTPRPSVCRSQGARSTPHSSFTPRLSHAPRHRALPTSCRRTRFPLCLPYSADDGRKHRQRGALPHCGDAVSRIPKRVWDDVGDSRHGRTGLRRVLLHVDVSIQRVRRRVLREIGEGAS